MFAFKICLGIYFLGWVLIYFIPPFFPKFYKDLYKDLNESLEEKLGAVFFVYILWPLSIWFWPFFAEPDWCILAKIGRGFVRGFILLGSANFWGYIGYYLPHRIILRWSQKRLDKVLAEMKERAAHADRYL